MAYKSKYSGLQIDDILDSVGSKQDKIDDLASIRAGATKGATALQSYTEKYTGTVTGIKINGETKSGSGVIDLGTISTDISGKQDKLVDGVNIATINGQSLTNGGDVTIEGGSLAESDITAMGFTKNTGTYSKPSGGIPKSDLASAVQTSLGKADTALQSYTEQYKGTVTEVKIDGTTKNPSSGAVDLGYINKKLTTSTSSSMTLSPNIYYRNTSTSLSTLTITLGSVSNSNIINEYFVEFTTRSGGTTVSLPSGIKWANGETPTFEENTTYQISIVNNLGTIQKFK